MTEATAMLGAWLTKLRHTALAIPLGLALGCERKEPGDLLPYHFVGDVHHASLLKGWAGGGLEPPPQGLLAGASPKRPQRFICGPAINIRCIP